MTAEPFRSSRTTAELREGEGDAIFFKTLREVDAALKFGRDEGDAFPILLVLSDINWRPLEDFYRLRTNEDGTRTFEGQVADMPDVRSLHHTHVWTLDGEHHVLTTHVVMRSGSSRDAVLKLKQEVRRLLDGQPFQHVTVDVEMEDEPCLADMRPPTQARGMRWW